MPSSNSFCWLNAFHFGQASCLCKFLYISIATFLLGCNDQSTLPEQGQVLDIQTLRTAQRIVPAKEGYVLVEAYMVPTESESTRQLLLYDHHGTFLDGIRLFGIVQRTGANRIVINHTFNDMGAESTLGFLAVYYDTLKRKSKGGGLAGSFWVDSLAYQPHTASVTVYARKPLQQFVLDPHEVVLSEEARFTERALLHLPLRTLRFAPTRDSYFSVTSWHEATHVNSTHDFYCRNPAVLNALFEQIVQSKTTSASTTQTGRVK